MVLLIIQLVIGCLFLLAGISFLRKLQNNRKVNTAPALAEVVDYITEIETDSDNLDTTVYYPVMRYSAAGHSYEQKYEFGRGTKKYEVGSQVEILYNPEDPMSFSIAGDKAAYILPIGIIILGAGLLLYTIYGFLTL